MANFITILRIILAIITVSLLFVQTVPVYILAFVLTVLVIWMDGLDGYVARKFNESSRFGAVLDILGDRIVENIYWITSAEKCVAPETLLEIMSAQGYNRLININENYGFCFSGYLISEQL